MVQLEASIVESKPLRFDAAISEQVSVYQHRSFLSRRAESIPKESGLLGEEPKLMIDTLEIILGYILTYC